jgi:ABC-2 type transport system permease protein
VKDLAGTASLVRLILRRDRVVLPSWVVVLGVLPMITAQALAELYPTPADVAVAARQVGSNPAFLALFGPVFDPSIGGLTAWRASIVLVVMALAGLLTVIRHTRVEEETGRRELVGSTVVGRHAPLTAALLVVIGANLAVAVLIAGGLIATDLPVAGSIAFGVAAACSGIVFATIGALAAQLTNTAGGARGIALSALGLAFVLRAAGDAAGGGDGSAWPSWLSPIGWAVQVRAFGDQRWWVVAMAAAAAAALAYSALRLEARRDVGAGIFASRLGPASASPQLAGPLALAWRLHSGSLIGWTIGIAVLGAIYGSVADGVADLLEDNPQMAEIFERLGGGAVITDAYLAAIIGMLALITAAYAIQAASRPRAEEEMLRADPVLATSVPRLAWMGSHLVFGFAGPALALIAGGVTAGATYGAISGDVPGQAARVAGAAAANLPAVWVLTAITTVIFGVAPRLMAGAWVAFSAVVVITLLGTVLQLSHWIIDLSPFTHIPRLPGGELLVAPLLWLLAVVVVLSCGGLLGFRRRDVG